MPRVSWPNHRFYFGTAGAEMSALIDGLRSRSDILDVTHGVPDKPGAVAGLYIQEEQYHLFGLIVV